MSPRPSAGASGSPPGQLIFRQSAARIKHTHRVRKFWTPVPENEVTILDLSARREARHQNAGNASKPQSIIDGPGCRASSVAKCRCPGAAHILKSDEKIAIFAREVCDVRAVNLIGAQHASPHAEGSPSDRFWRVVKFAQRPEPAPEMPQPIQPANPSSLLSYRCFATPPSAWARRKTGLPSPFRSARAGNRRLN